MPSKQKRWGFDGQSVDHGALPTVVIKKLKVNMDPVEEAQNPLISHAVSGREDAFRDGDEDGGGDGDDGRDENSGDRE
ncbi:hypothetical protein V502_06625 [Pseudogymnoascus sp. VKM F-4520 (FW-2644)]|nr:hypothetical protein V502_06625 [Pseudogymnoascus sp. VKM F-4520 (FW-2644)]